MTLDAILLVASKGSACQSIGRGVQQPSTSPETWYAQNPLMFLPEFVFKSGAILSHSFFLGLRTASGAPSKPSKLTLSPTGTPSGTKTGSTLSCASLDAHNTCSRNQDLKKKHNLFPASTCNVFHTPCRLQTKSRYQQPINSSACMLAGINALLSLRVSQYLKPQPSSMSASYSHQSQQRKLLPRHVRRLIRGLRYSQTLCAQILG